MPDLGRRDFERLLRLAAPSEGLLALLRLSDDGVHYDGYQVDRVQIEGLEWKPVHDMVGPDKPRSDGPALPFPFSPAHLAAFLLDGWGAQISEALAEIAEAPTGRKAHGDDQDVLEAVAQARALHDAAELVVGRRDEDSLTRAHRLSDDLARARQRAFARRQRNPASVGRNRDNREQAVNAALRGFQAKVSKAHLEEDAAFVAWRKAMVQQMLQPRSTAASLPSIGPGEASWPLRKPGTVHGYNRLLYLFLAAARNEGRPRPTHHDVLRAWSSKAPPGISDVTPRGFSYLDADGRLKPVDSEALRQAIRRLCKPIP